MEFRGKGRKPRMDRIQAGKQLQNPVDPTNALDRVTEKVDGKL